MSNWDIQSVFSYLSESKQCLQHAFRWSFVSEAIVSCKKTMQSFSLAAVTSKALDYYYIQLLKPPFLDTLNSITERISYQFLTK